MEKQGVGDRSIETLTISDHRSIEFPGENTEITISGGHAMSVHNSSCWRIQKQGRPVEWFEPPTCLASGDSGYNTGMLAELDVFTDRVRQGAAPLENLETSYHTLRFYDAIRLSVKKGGELISLNIQ